MFDEKQINSYNCITAPADLRQRVMTACENTKTVKKPSISTTVYRLAPLAACVLLFFSVLALNRSEPLLLQAGDTQLSSESIQLPPMAEPVAIAEPAAYGMRSYSLEPAQYTVTLTVNQDVEILSADGLTTMGEDDKIIWTVDVPTNDMVYELFLFAGDATYYVTLRYHVQDGSFSIQYEAQ